MKKLVYLRRLSQISFLLLFTYILWSTTYPLRGLIKPQVLFKADPLIMLVTSISERVVLQGIAVSISAIVLTLILGRFFCGWMCPLGTVIDFVGKGKKEHGQTKRTKVKNIKFFVLGTMFAFSVMGAQVAWVFDPLVIAARFISLNVIPTVTFLINKFFIAFIQFTDYHQHAVDIYHGLKASFLGVKTEYFSHAPVILLFFMFIIVTTLFSRRFWCRNLCPLGALYGALAKVSLLKRYVATCKHCGICKSRCRMDAIYDDMSYDSAECIMCMDCIYDCPQVSTRFAFRPAKEAKELQSKDNEKEGISRRSFLLLLTGSLIAFMRNGFTKGIIGVRHQNIRPPGAVDESEFLNRCVRCGNCMKVCPTNALQPVMIEGGIEGLWTPQLVPVIGYCEYSCTLCGSVCPTQAIEKLNLRRKKKTVIGIAKIDRDLCLPWKDKKECIVCEEHCPVPEKAIKLEEEAVEGEILLKPKIDRDLCIGCGICETKCPTRPKRSVIVYPKGHPSLITPEEEW